MTKIAKRIIFVAAVVATTAAAAPESERFLRVEEYAAMAVEASAIAGGNLTKRQAWALAASLEACERRYGVNPVVALCVAHTESDFRVACVNVNVNKDGSKTEDWGLFQVNSTLWERLSTEASRMLDEEGVPYSRDRFDPALNAACAIAHMAWSKKVLAAKGVDFFPTWVQSYNCGVRGSTCDEPFWVARRGRYYARFMNCAVALGAMGTGAELPL